jgi:hypothetical protein
MLGLNSSLANHLNLKKKSKEENPDDFYTFISSFLYKYYEHKLNENISDIDRDSFKRLKLLQIQRSVIKKTIMTIPYNVSSIQGINYLKESFEFDKEYTDSMINLLQNKDGFIEENEDNLYKDNLNLLNTEDENSLLDLKNHTMSRQRKRKSSLSSLKKSSSSNLEPILLKKIT